MCCFIHDLTYQRQVTGCYRTMMSSIAMFIILNRIFLSTGLHGFNYKTNIFIVMSIDNVINKPT